MFSPMIGNERAQHAALVHRPRIWHFGGKLGFWWKRFDVSHEASALGRMQMDMKNPRQTWLTDADGRMPSYHR